MPGLPIGLVAAAILIEVLLVILRIIAAEPVATIETLIAAHSVYLVTVFLVLRKDHQEHRKFPALFIIGAAMVFRITAFPIPAPLTEDLYRYRWEGKVQAYGGNPYTSRPVDANWIHLRDETWPRVGQKDVPAGYGPAMELLSLGMYRAATAITPDPERQAFWFKLPAIVFDFGILSLLSLWLRSRKLPPKRLLIYAWSPLPIWEFWASGHNDAPMVFFLVLTLLLGQWGRWKLAHAALGMAIALKLWPVLLVPALVLRARQWLGPAIAGAVFALFSMPYLTDIGWNVRYMSGFVGGWRNNDSLFGLLLWLTGDQYRAKYLAFFLIASAALWCATRSWPLERVFLWTIVSLLLLSSNCHPWYLTWFAPLLVFEPVVPLLLWAALMPLNYAVWIEWSLLGVWNGSTSLRWLVYGPVFILLGARFGRHFLRAPNSVTARYQK